MSVSVPLSVIESDRDRRRLLWVLSVAFLFWSCVVWNLDQKSFGILGVGQHRLEAVLIFLSGAVVGTLVYIGWGSAEVAQQARHKFRATFGCNPEDAMATETVLTIAGQLGRSARGAFERVIGTDRGYAQQPDAKTLRNLKNAEHQAKHALAAFTAATVCAKDWHFVVPSHITAPVVCIRKRADLEHHIALLEKQLTKFNLTIDSGPHRIEAHRNLSTTLDTLLRMRQRMLALEREVGMTTEERLNEEYEDLMRRFEKIVGQS